jgi:hypothetical protein
VIIALSPLAIVRVMLSEAKHLSFHFSVAKENSQRFFASLRMTVAVQCFMITALNASRRFVPSVF